MSMKGQFEAMLNTDAWKRLEQWADEERERSRDIIDSIPAKDLNSNHVCEERGIRKGMMKLVQQAHFFAENR